MYVSSNFLCAKIIINSHYTETIYSTEYTNDNIKTTVNKWAIAYDWMLQIGS